MRANRMTSVSKIEQHRRRDPPRWRAPPSLSFGSQAGPPLNNAMYNNNLQFVQTADTCMIDVEVDHDARIIGITREGAQRRRVRPTSSSGLAIQSRTGKATRLSSSPATSTRRSSRSAAFRFPKRAGHRVVQAGVG